MMSTLRLSLTLYDLHNQTAYLDAKMPFWTLDILEYCLLWIRHTSSHEYLNSAFILIALTKAILH